MDSNSIVGLNKPFNVNDVVTKNYVDIDEYKRFKEVLERGISNLSFSFRMVEIQLENI